MNTDFINGLGSLGTAGARRQHQAVKDSGSFIEAIRAKAQVFPDGDMSIPQPPIYGNFHYNSSLDTKAKADMTLDEYKQWFMHEMSQMPVSGYYQSSFVGTLVIKEDAFTRMKQDPAYEKEILGMLKRMYSVNGLPGGKNICYQVIGASAEECYGYAYPMKSPSLKKDEEEESWWDKRQKRIEENLREQALLGSKRALEQKHAAQRQQAEALKLRNFLTGNAQSSPEALVDSNLLLGADAFDALLMQLQVKSLI